MSIDIVTSPLLAGTRHGFLSRRGGVSTGVVAGLNVGFGSGDDPAAIEENRRRAVAAIASEAALATVFQVHSADVVTVTEPIADDSRARADALVTDRPELVLGILTADCAPVLLADVAAGVVGAAHAGWKGAIGGVTDATIVAMEALGAQRARLVATVGPCIGQASYEVDDVFRHRFCDEDPDNEAFFNNGRPGHAYFALAAYVAARLSKSGLAGVEVLDLDTCALPDRYYSYRRATLAGAATYGRQMSLIALA